MAEFQLSFEAASQRQRAGLQLEHSAAAVAAEVASSAIHSPLRHAPPKGADASGVLSADDAAASANVGGADEEEAASDESSA